MQIVIESHKKIPEYSVYINGGPDVRAYSKRMLKNYLNK